MTGLGIMLGALSMLIGVAALWLAADARHKAEGQTAQLVRSQSTVLRKSVEDVAGIVAVIDQRLKDTERRLELRERERGEVLALREELSVVRAALGSIRDAASPNKAASALRH